MPEGRHGKGQPGLAQGGAFFDCIMIWLIVPAPAGRYQSNTRNEQGSLRVFGR